jgi:cellulose synthase/poly-beta-1,6-N-acetylglucosamine synthase-like glycosyltransferase
MGSAWTVISVGSIAAAVVLLAYWGAGLARLVATARRVPTARAGLSLNPPRSSVCVVVPAHNEERCIGELVESLRRQDHPRASFVLCLDRCTDQTESIARAAAAGNTRFEIVSIDVCPVDWAGKVHAAWTGLNRSRAARDADVLLFIDADTVLDPGCIRATLALLESRGLALLSVLSTLTHDRWFERLVQPAAGLELVVQFPILRAWSMTRRRPFANGQFMMFRRDAYEAAGGHAAVHAELLEDLALARLVGDRGLPAGVVLADGMVTCRMYPDWRSFRRGWKRIYTESAKRKPVRLRRASWRVRLLGTVLPLVMILGLVAAAASWETTGPAIGTACMATEVAALATWAAVIAAGYRMARTPLWCVLAYPAGAWAVGSILHEAARDLEAGRGTEWGGRTYARDAR